MNSDDTEDDPADDEGLAEIVADQGEKIAEQQWSGGSWSSVYKFENRYYVIDEVEMTVFDDANAALLRANIGSSDHDSISHVSVAPAYRHLVSSDDDSTD
jgi:hypothetical protein